MLLWWGISCDVYFVEVQIYVVRIMLLIIFALKISA